LAKRRGDVLLTKIAHSTLKERHARKPRSKLDPTSVQFFIGSRSCSGWLAGYPHSGQSYSIGKAWIASPSSIIDFARLADYNCANTTSLFLETYDCSSGREDRPANAGLFSYARRNEWTPKSRTQLKSTDRNSPMCLLKTPGLLERLVIGGFGGAENISDVPTGRLGATADFWKGRFKTSNLRR